MLSFGRLRIIFSMFAGLLAFGALPLLADSSHARIVRLSLIQGDVRFARETHGDPLVESRNTWEAAVLNLPMRQGYVLSTDAGRAEVEFENGAMAFLSENTVLEFYDLSLEDGALTTRLVLRQGTARFYVNPARGDYFSVTGGDFTIEADGKTSFRLDSFDDGSNVAVEKGRATVLHKEKNTRLEKGQTLSVKAGDDASLQIGRIAGEDEFDHWVSGRVDSVVTATNASLQYTNYSPYTAGVADLYTYGAWFPVSGYGSCWRPFGVGLGWSPYSAGNWFLDPTFGWLFFGNAAWGWTPYHFGGWFLAPGYGWVWSPGSSFAPGRPLRWRSANAVFVRSGGTVAAVPVHPLDGRRGKPLNLASGAVPVAGRGTSERLAFQVDEKAKIIKSPSRGEVAANSYASSAPPSRVSRTLASGSGGMRAVSVGRDSSISYDPRERRFVNSSAGAGAPAARTTSGNMPPAMVDRVAAAGQPATPAAPSRPVVPASGRAPVPPSSTRAGNTPPPAPRSITPPPAPRGGFGGSSSASSGSARPSTTWGGGGGSSRPSSPPPSSSPRPSGGRPH